MIYLAGPYTDKSTSMMEFRFEAFNRVAALLMTKGHIICSPVSMNHPMVKYGLPVDWAFWEKFDTAFLEMCTAIYVLKLKGWENSKGLKAELEIAKGLGLKVTYLEPKDYGVRE